MQTNIPESDRAAWAAWQKIVFRFFFLFLSLQTVTEVFWGNLFGNTLMIWRLGEKIFVAPCLWLNNHIFHFTYIPPAWTTFSAALHTIRDIVYLIATCIGCLLWTIIDRKRPNYNKLLYWFSQWLIMLLACIVFAYGVSKIIPVQMNAPAFTDLYKPVGTLSPFSLLWTTFGYGKPYQVFTGICEVLGAIMILFKRTRMAGLLIIASVMVNVMMLNYTYRIGVLTLSFYIFLVCLFLLSAYARKLLYVFFTDQPVVISKTRYEPDKNSRLQWLKVPMFLFIAFSFIAESQFAYSRYARRALVNKSRKYSLVKTYVIDNDTMQLIEGDTTCWRIWSERVTDGKRMVTITTMNPAVSATYTFGQDSLQHRLTLHPFNAHDTMPLLLNYTNINSKDWHLEGMINQKKLQVDLQRINPDTMFTLLKTKRKIIEFDDEASY